MSWWTQTADKFLKKEFWQGVLASHGGAETDGSRRYTLEELRALYDVLDKNPVVSEANRALVVETIRSIAEFMIWGDQHEPRIFDFLMENNIMAYLYHILQPAANRTGAIAKQVLQTLSIIVQNIRSETGVFFLFSNNHINHIVETGFDFEDEEVLGFFISFLKAISLKLNPQTVQFFIILPEESEGPAAAGSPAAAAGKAQGQPRLPLYTEAIKLAHHKEGMVRAGVRTLTLSVFSLRDDSVQQLLTSPPAAQYFAHIAQYMARQVQVLQDSMLGVFNCYSSQALSHMDSELAELEDMLAYCHDVFETAPPGVCQLLSQQLWDQLLVPALLTPIEAAAAAGPSVSSQQLAECAVGLYALERCFLLLGCTPMLNNLALAVLGLPPPLPVTATTPSDANASTAADALQQQQQQQMPQVQVVSCRAALLYHLASAHPLVATTVCRMLVALQRSKGLSPEVQLLMGLTGHGLTAPATPSPETQAAAGRVLAALSHAAKQQQLQGGHQGGQVGSITGGRVSQSSSAQGLAQDELRTPTPGPPPPQFAFLEAFSCPSASAAPASAAQAVLSPAASAHAPLISWSDDEEGGQGGHASHPHGLHLHTTHGIPLSEATIISQVVEDVLQGVVTEVAADCAALAATSGTPSQPGEPSSGAAAAQQHQQGGGIHAAGAPSLSNAPKGPAGGPPPSLYSLPLAHTPDHIGHDMLSALLALLAQPRVPVLTLQLAAHLLLSCLRHKLPARPPPPPPAPRPPSQPNSPLRRGLQSSSTGGTGTPQSPLSPAAAAAAAALSSTSSSGGATTNTTSTSSAAAILGPELSALLMSALTSAAASVAEQLDRCWPDAFFPIFQHEWGAAEAALRAPGLHPNGDQLMTGAYMQLADQATYEAMGLGVTAIQAMQLCHAVQRFACVLRLGEALHVLGGRGPQSTQLLGWQVADLNKAWVDVVEGQQVALSKANSVPCQVCFKPPDPVHVHLAVAGDAAKVVLGPTEQPLRFKGVLLHASPTVVLAQCANNCIDAGFVVSTAPLLGSLFHADAKVGVWLHVIVRPAVQSLLKQVRRAGTRRGGLAACLRSLSDGHWILQFPEDKRVQAALHLVDTATGAARRAYKDLVGNFLNAWLDAGLA